MDAISEPLTGLLPAMSQAEQALLCAAAAGRQAGLEFGCGGSTGLLLAAGLGRLLSVDSDRAWLDRVAVEPANAEAMAAGRLRLMHVDIGPTAAWGWPTDPACLPRWPAYWRDPWEAVAGPVDLVLVDGRFRIACALFGLPRLAPGALLLVHDFWSRAAYRPPLLRHYELAGSAGTLALLTPRATAAAMLAADLAAYAFDPG
ncbi:class I SAM-dependent methyltransferase [Belnapia rosea]|uniref:Methyltransferase domain-containing protein n=1 Tax=Belnapia rosea TaxID=938405 RepID=A0A1G6KG01_9PROT|nr:class I SAM-dependent methyltransferase [Belnapia rosea]SDB18602.1 Methyltransferase domain-containing protein [Belnapia rosea]SDC29884.1 Methyltransferase domain-containing protein [Belnapia rosea]